jgi:hypothetical protein
MCRTSCSGGQRRRRGEAGGQHVLDDLGGDDLAGTAPGGEAVEDHERVLDVQGLVEGGLAERLLATMTSSCARQAWRVYAEYSRLEVVDTGVGHFACAGEELGGEEGSVEIGGGCGVDRGCLQARRGKQRSCKARGRRSEHDLDKHKR